MALTKYSGNEDNRTAVLSISLARKHPAMDAGRSERLNWLVFPRQSIYR